MKSRKKSKSKHQGANFNLLTSVKREIEIFNMLKKTNQILNKIEKDYNVYAIIPSYVRKFGNSGHISIPRKYRGRKVKVFILKEMEEKKKGQK